MNQPVLTMHKPRRILVFGNPLFKDDSIAIQTARFLQKKLPEFHFVPFDTSEDLEKEGKDLLILDTVIGIRSPRLVSLDELSLKKPYSLHDFDLAWTLLLLKKLKKLEKATIIGLPARPPTKKTYQQIIKLLRSLS
ncbi:MAG: hypothetical protein QXW70_03425 [Candidatus Anstonellales archaeon]